jgi:hypothetical protein
VDNDFWNNVKNLIKKNATYQEWVAGKCGVKPRTFQNWIYRNIPPNILEGQKIAEALETTVEYLVTGQETAFPGLSPEAIEIARAADRLSPEGRIAALKVVRGMESEYPFADSGLSSEAK